MFSFSNKFRLIKSFRFNSLDTTKWAFLILGVIVSLTLSSCSNYIATENREGIIQTTSEQENLNRALYLKNPEENAPFTQASDVLMRSVDIAVGATMKEKDEARPVGTVEKWQKDPHTTSIEVIASQHQLRKGFSFLTIEGLLPKDWSWGNIFTGVMTLFGVGGTSAVIFLKKLLNAANNDNDILKAAKGTIQTIADGLLKDKDALQIAKDALLTDKSILQTDEVTLETLIAGGDSGRKSLKILWNKIPEKERNKLSDIIFELSKKNARNLNELFKYVSESHSTNAGLQARVKEKLAKVRDLTPTEGGKLPKGLSAMLDM